MSHPWLLGEMQGVLQTMKATGKSQFSLEEIENFVQQASEEAGEVHYQELLKEHPEIAEQLEAETQPISWEEIEEDLSSFPELKDNSDMDMEM